MATLKPYEVVTVANSFASRARFRDWVAMYGISRLARSLGATRQMVYRWLPETGTRYPHVTTVQKIMMLSTVEPLEDGPLSYEDILGRVAIASQQTHTEAREASVHHSFDLRPFLRTHDPLAWRAF